MSVSRIQRPTQPPDAQRLGPPGRQPPTQPPTSHLRYQTRFLDSFTTPLELAGENHARIAVLVTVRPDDDWTVVVGPDRDQVAQGDGLYLDPGDSVVVETAYGLWGLLLEPLADHANVSILERIAGAPPESGY